MIEEGYFIWFSRHVVRVQRMRLAQSHVAKNAVFLFIVPSSSDSPGIIVRVHGSDYKVTKICLASRKHNSR